VGIKKCFSVIGYHNTGKTTLISKMIPLIKERALTVSTIKHAKHLSLKDSDILFQSGSEETIAIADDFSLRYLRLSDLRSLVGLINSDILIVEGFKGEALPKIVRGKSLTEVKGLLDELTIACVLDEFGKEELFGIPIFFPDDLEGIVETALERSFPPLPLFNCGRCGMKDCYEMAKAIIKGERSYNECAVLPSKLCLKVNDIQIPLKPFVQEVFIALNTALVRTLKESPGEIKRIELRIEI